MPPSKDQEETIARPIIIQDATLRNYLHAFRVVFSAPQRKAVHLIVSWFFTVYHLLETPAECIIRFVTPVIWVGSVIVIRHKPQQRDRIANIGFILPELW